MTKAVKLPRQPFGNFKLFVSLCLMLVSCLLLWNLAVNSTVPPKYLRNLRFIEEVDLPREANKSLTFVSAGDQKSNRVSKKMNGSQPLLSKKTRRAGPAYLTVLKMVARDIYNLKCNHTISLPKQHEFIPESKNPCYRDQDSGKLRCLPYFYLPGFSKCGTTDLFSAIKHHPEFVLSHKEYHWFNYLQYTDKYGDFEYYPDMFDALAGKIDQDIKVKGYSTRITGDFTPAYLCDTLRWKCIKENVGLKSPKVTNAHFVYRVNPNAKIVILIREPADRLYSRFRHMMRNVQTFREMWGKSSPQSFHRAAVRAVGNYTECFKYSSMRDCLYNNTVFKKVMINDFGLYPTCLQDWLSIFPRENFLFLKYEDYADGREDIVKTLFQFLNMGDPPKGLQKALNTSKVVNKGQRTAPMLKETRELLRRFFTPLVKELKNIVGEDFVRSWGY